NQMLATAYRAFRAADYRRRQRIEVVLGRVAHVAAPDDRRMIEQAAVAFRRFGEARDQLRCELLGEQPHDLAARSAVRADLMRQRMPRIRDPERREYAHADLLARQEGAYVRQIGLERQ